MRTVRVTCLKKEYNAQISKIAKNVMRTEKVKNVLLDMKAHFKTNKWYLDYEHYKAEISTHPPVANRVLELAGYIITHTKNNPNLLIKPRKRK